MQPGSFYCFVPKKGAVTGWLPFCKNSQRGVVRRINALLKKECEGESDEAAVLDESDLFHSSCHDLLRNTLSLIYPGAGITVRSGELKLTSHLSRKEPNVYQTEKAFIVLHGYISNVEDLCMRMGRFSPFKNCIVENEDEVEWTIGDLAARVILHLYLGDKAKDPLLVLSELQGHYAFVIYDSEDKSVFAARDASGQQQLYYAMDLEKGLSLSNAPLTDVDENWQEVPAGHYLYGRHPQLLQFALTADQLTARWSLDLDDETELYSSLDSAEHEVRRSWSLGLVGSFRNRVSPASHDAFPQTL